MKSSMRSSRNYCAQQLFRHYWYSVDCAKAFPAAGLNVTAEQEQKIAALSTMLTETRKALQGIRMSSMQRRSRLRYSRFDLHREGNEVYLMLKDRFEDTLDELVGTVAAKQLLGEPMQHDRNWKPPRRRTSGDDAGTGDGTL